MNPITPFPEYPLAQMFQTAPGEWWWTCRSDLWFPGPGSWSCAWARREGLMGYSMKAEWAIAQLESSLGLGFGDPGVAEAGMLREAHGDR